MNSTKLTAIPILLVDDNQDDVILTRHAFEKLPWKVEIHTASDGISALAMLRNEPPHENLPQPSIILLDLNLPRMDGRQLLRELKTDPVLRTIPSVILTTSDFEEDISTSYANYANAYLTKPVDFRRFVRDVDQLCHFWFKLVTLPPTRRGAGNELRRLPATQR
jgi:CheY-like chemotaxis protein